MYGDVSVLSQAEKTFAAWPDISKSIQELRHIANAFKIPALILCGHFANFKKYMSYSGAYQEKGGIAHIYFNASGSTRELPFLEVWEELQKTILTSKSLALKAV
mgnify:CR=1 FL=1